MLIRLRIHKKMFWMTQHAVTLQTGSAVKAAASNFRCVWTERSCASQTVSFSEDTKHEINLDLLDHVAWCQIQKLTVKITIIPL